MESITAAGALNMLLAAQILFFLFSLKHIIAASKHPFILKACFFPVVIPVIQFVFNKKITYRNFEE